LFGFRQILGTEQSWHFLISFPIVIGTIGMILLIVWLPESPNDLILRFKDDAKALKTIQKLRNSENVSNELDELNAELMSSNKSQNDSITLIQLIKAKDLRLPLILSVVMQISQQMCGINAVFFYSERMFRNASIQPEHIQYAVFVVGAINVITTIITVPLIDRIGRKPLIVIPMIIMIVDFIILTLLLVFQVIFTNFIIIIQGKTYFHGKFILSSCFLLMVNKLVISKRFFLTECNLLQLDLFF
jgi:Na+/melibiose symporter-like transporter